MNTQLTDNEALELKALIAPSDEELAKIENLEEVKPYLLALTELRLSSNKDAEEILPESIGKLSNLQKLSIYGNYLKKLPESIGHLKQLEELSLGGYHQLRSISIKSIKEIQKINPNRYKDYFEQFIIFPESIGELEKLKKLTMYFCDIKNLPKNIGNLKQLKTLHLEHCTILEELTESIGDLTELTKLTLFCCENITMLPESIVNLNNTLEELNFVSSTSDPIGIYNNFDITPILEKICQLTKLKKLNINSHTNLHELPECISNLTQLTHLYLHNCIFLNKLPKCIGNLTELQVLTLSNCGITTLPENFGALENLKELYCDYKNIESLPLSFLQLKSLKEDYLRVSLQEINKIQEEEKQRQLLDILLCVLKIREELSVKDNFYYNSNDYEKTVAHYATPYVAMKLLKQEKDENGKNKQNPLWLGSVAYVNDPAEGKVIFEYFNRLDILKNNNITLKPVSTLATFVGCFTFNPDSLNQFRLYGKENGKEATGVSIVIDDNFFGTNHSNVSNQQTEKDFSNKLPLYRCIYLDPKSRISEVHISYDGILEYIDELSNKEYYGIEYCKPHIQIAHRSQSTFYKEKSWNNYPSDWNRYFDGVIKPIQEKIINLFENIERDIILLFEDINNIDNRIAQDKKKIRSILGKDFSITDTVIISKIEEEIKEKQKQLIETVSFILLPLSYMVKHSAYEEEQECRIFRFVSFNDQDIKTDIGNKRIYVEYLPMYYHNKNFGQTYVDTYIQKIYLSPYAEKYADMFRALSNGRVEVRSSDNPFR